MLDNDCEAAKIAMVWPDNQLPPPIFHVSRTRATVTVNAATPRQGIQLNLFRFTQREKKKKKKKIPADFSQTGPIWLG